MRLSHPLPDQGLFSLFLRGWAIMLFTDLSWHFGGSILIYKSKIKHSLPFWFFLLLFCLFVLFFSNIPSSSYHHIMNKTQKICTVPHKVPPDWLLSGRRRAAWHIEKGHLRFCAKSVKFTISSYCQPTRVTVTDYLAWL